LLTDIDIGVNGIPYDLKLMYTTGNQSFKFYVVMAWWWSKWPKLVATNLNNRHCCVRLKTYIFIIVFQHVFIFKPHKHKFHMTAVVSQD